MKIDIEKHLATLRDVGPLFAEAKGHRAMCEGLLKVTFAEQVRLSQGKTVAEREADAMVSAGYREALDGYAVAVEQEEKHRRALITAEAAIEVWRSLESTNRRMDRAAA